MAGFCKLVAQNWHKNIPLVRACIDFICSLSDCEELVGGYLESCLTVKRNSLPGANIFN